jgi:hypothetical protein
MLLSMPPPPDCFWNCKQDKTLNGHEEQTCEGQRRSRHDQTCAAATARQGHAFNKQLLLAGATVSAGTCTQHVLKPAPKSSGAQG